MTTRASEDSVALIEAADRQIEKVRTRALDVSFNELADMYTAQELIIDPEYQRLFRWSEAKQSRFIESILLELPLPPIFVIERSEGEYELIDGLQRISSYLHFRGELDAPLREIKKGDCLKLVDCDIVDMLNDKTFADLPKALEIRLKRAFIRMEVVRSESDKRLRYHMFKRLNTGGEQLSEQEIRNCTIRLLDGKFNEFLISCSQNVDFMTCISKMADEKIEAKGDQELVLRFFAFRNNREDYKHKVGDFLTEYMERVSAGDLDFDYEEQREVFERTFEVLSASLGDEAFSSVDKNNRKQPFSIYQFEAFALGIQRSLAELDPQKDDQMGCLRDCAWKKIKEDTTFREIVTGGGKNSRGPLAERIQFVEKRLQEWLEVGEDNAGGAGSSGS